MSEFHDDRLGDELRRRATADVSIGSAHDAVLARAGAIRRRRALTAGGGTLAVALIGVLMFAPGDRDDALSPADSGTPISSVDDDRDAVPSTSTDVSTTVGTTVGSSDTVTTVRGATATSTVATPSTVTTPSATPRSTTAPSTTAPSGTPAPSSTVASATPTTSADTIATTSVPTTSSSLPTTSSSVATLAPFTDTYDSTGGAITVSWNGSALTLQSVAAKPGYVAEIEDQTATRIRVDFEADDDDNDDAPDSRIEVRVDDGRLRVDID